MKICNICKLPKTECDSFEIKMIDVVRSIPNLSFMNDPAGGGFYDKDTRKRVFGAEGYCHKIDYESAADYKRSLES